MSKITKIEAREILDSRGNPTVEVEVELESGVKEKAGVPSGASTGKFEALELRDGEETRYGGKGVQGAVKNVNEKIAPVVQGMDVLAQREIDQKMIALDATENKSLLGANAILGVSLAVARAASKEKGVELYQYINVIAIRQLAEKQSQGLPQSLPNDKSFAMTDIKIPVPMFNILNGGEHSDSGLAIQEFKVVPAGIKTFAKQLQAGSEIFHQLKKNLESANQTTGVGDEGGFAPHLESNRQALEYIGKAIEEAGYKLGEEVSIGIDAAASSFFDEENNSYIFKPENPKVERESLINIYREWVEKFKLISIEDGLNEEDWEGWKILNEKMGNQVILIGDDLLVTNVKRLEEALKQKACNAVLVKPNQIGSLSETLDFVKKAQENNLKVVVSHRSGETLDDFIADLSVGVGADFIKTGAPNRGERLAKYNRLAKIEELLGIED